MDRAGGKRRVKKKNPSATQPVGKVFAQGSFFLTRLLHQHESKPCVRGSPRHQGHSRCFFGGRRPHLRKRLARGGGGGGLRKELAEWRGVAVTVGLARRDRAEEEGLRKGMVGGRREQGGPTGNESGDD